MNGGVLAGSSYVNSGFSGYGGCCGINPMQRAIEMLQQLAQQVQLQQLLQQLLQFERNDGCDSDLDGDRGCRFPQPYHRPACGPILPTAGQCGPRGAAQPWTTRQSGGQTISEDGNFRVVASKDGGGTVKVYDLHDLDSHGQPKLLQSDSGDPHRQTSAGNTTVNGDYHQSQNEVFVSKNGARMEMNIQTVNADGSLHQPGQAGASYVGAIQLRNAAGGMQINGIHSGEMSITSGHLNRWEFGAPGPEEVVNNRTGEITVGGRRVTNSQEFQQALTRVDQNIDNPQAWMEDMMRRGYFMGAREAQREAELMQELMAQLQALAGGGFNGCFDVNMYRALANGDCCRCQHRFSFA